MEQKVFSHSEDSLPRDPQAGFTLVEMMVVIVIMGLLATIVVINVLPNQDRAMLEKANADVRLLDQAVEMYRLDNLSYPSVEDGLASLVEPPADLARNDRYKTGGYIRQLPDDPWGNPYQYVYPGEHGTFDIYSLGADGELGGEENDADIGNWQ